MFESLKGLYFGRYAFRGLSHFRTIKFIYYYISKQTICKEYFQFFTNFFCFGDDYKQQLKKEFNYMYVVTFCFNQM